VTLAQLAVRLVERVGLADFGRDGVPQVEGIAVDAVMFAGERDRRVPEGPILGPPADETLVEPAELVPQRSGDGKGGGDMPVDSAGGGGDREPTASCDLAGWAVSELHPVVEREHCLAGCARPMGGSPHLIGLDEGVGVADDRYFPIAG